MLILVVAALLAAWGVWDYHRNGKISPLGYANAVVALGFVMVVVIRELVT